MYGERGQNPEEAIQFISKALDLEPDNGYFIDSLGWAYYQQGRYGEALRELKRAVEKAKEPDPVIYDHLGDAYAKNGLTEDALAAWEKSLQLDPTADGVKKKLEELRSRQQRVKGERSRLSQWRGAPAGAGRLCARAAAPAPTRLRGRPPGHRPAGRTLARLLGPPHPRRHSPPARRRTAGPDRRPAGEGARLRQVRGALAPRSGPAPGDDPRRPAHR